MSAVPTEFVSGLAARRRLRCGYSGIVRAALLGQIRVEILPGACPRYCSADVDRLAESRHRNTNEVNQPL